MQQIIEKMISQNRAIDAKYQNNEKKTPAAPFFSLSQKLENYVLRFLPLAYLYSLLFYRNMLKRELAMAGLKPGSRVVHIGCGPYPFTAIYLAQRGYRVDACDCNNKAVESAKKMVQERGVTGEIEFKCTNGTMIDCSGYDAVWISLNIDPKEVVIRKCLHSLQEGSLLVYRSLPSWMAAFFQNAKPLCLHEGREIKRSFSPAGIKSAVIRRVY